MITSKGIRAIGGIVFIIIFFYLGTKWFFPKMCNESNSDFKNMEFSGAVMKLYIDSTNHLAPSLLLDDSTVLQFSVDTSSFYKNVGLNDILIKSKGSNIIHVKSGKIANKYAIYYNCY